MDRERGLKTAAENSVIGRGTRGGRTGRGERLFFYFYRDEWLPAKAEGGGGRALPVPSIVT